MYHKHNCSKCEYKDSCIIDHAYGTHWDLYLHITEMQTGNYAQLVGRFGSEPDEYIAEELHHVLREKEGPLYQLWEMFGN